MTEKAKIPLNQSQIIKIKSMNPLNTQKTFENRIKNFKNIINFLQIIEF